MTHVLSPLGHARCGDRRCGSLAQRLPNLLAGRRDGHRGHGRRHRSEQGRGAGALGGGCRGGANASDAAVAPAAQRRRRRADRAPEQSRAPSRLQPARHRRGARGQGKQTPGPELCDLGSLDSDRARHRAQDHGQPAVAAHHAGTHQNRRGSVRASGTSRRRGDLAGGGGDTARLCARGGDPPDRGGARRSQVKCRSFGRPRRAAQTDRRGEQARSGAPAGVRNGNGRRVR